jgi:hypothetical protein
LHWAGQPSAFTYQGYLSDAGSPANGLYDFRFELFDSPTNGVSVGLVTNVATDMAGGFFTVSLDFGDGIFDGTDLWLEIGAKTNGSGALGLLSPRQPVTSAPYAMQAAHSASVESGSITDPSFLGNTTGDPLELSLAGMPALRIQAGFSPGGLQPSIVAGHPSNEIDEFVRGSVIAGGGIEGASNAISGDFNTAFSVISGGVDNHITYCSRAVITGGSGNRIHTNASYSIIAGGLDNEIGVGAFGAFAAGLRAKAIHPGSFVWADWHHADFASTTNDQFNIRAGGGVRIETSGSGMTVDGEPVFVGTDGSTLQFLDASQLTSGALPGARLSGTYSSTVTFDNAGNDFTGVFRSDAFDFAAAPGFTWSADSDTGMFRPGSDALALSTAGTERMRITSSGQVGIGTSDPDGATLRVEGEAAAGEIWLSPSISGGNADIFLSETVSGSFGIKLRHNGANNLLEFIGVNSSSETAPLVTIGRGSSSGMSIANDLTVGGDVTATAFNTSSDRSAKENVLSVDTEDVLQKVASMPISQWNFKNETARHVGPMAQDFHAAFGLGANDTTIATVDADGVALAAIQGLNQKLEQKDAQIVELRHELHQLRALVETLIQDTTEQ